MIHEGDVIDDRFEVLQLLGEGGLAQVWKVRHRELGSVHALKLLMFRKARLAERLILEGRIQAQLRHPNVVKVTDVVRHRGQVGLLMEYVEGANLEHLTIKVGAMELDRALSLAAAIISGVVAAHDQGVLHRDLKPANILLSREPRGLVPKVTDFGIAKVVAGAEDFTETRVGAVMGTPGYLAPEQATDASTVDARADVFALGALVYELLAGRRAFEGADLAEALDAELVPLAEAGRPDVPEPVAQAIATALSKDPDARHPTCRAFAEALFVERPDLLEVATSSHGGEPLSLSAALGPVTPTGEVPRGQAPTLAPDHDASTPSGAGSAPDAGSSPTPPAFVPADGGEGASSRMRWLALAALLLGGLGAFALRTAGVGDRPVAAASPDEAREPASADGPDAASATTDAAPKPAPAAPGDPAAPASTADDDGADPADAGVSGAQTPDRDGQATVSGEDDGGRPAPTPQRPPEDVAPDPAAAAPPAADAAPATDDAPPADPESPPTAEADPADGIAGPSPDAPADDGAPGDDGAGSGEPASSDDPPPSADGPPDPDAGTPPAPEPASDDGVAVVEPTPDDGVAVVEPTPDEGELDAPSEAVTEPPPPPEPEAPEMLGLWRGTAGGRPMRLRVTGQDGADLTAEVVFLLGPTERRHALRGTWQPGGALTFVESGGGLTLSGSLDGTSMGGTYAMNGGGRSQKWSATWASR